jgi:hypothetical protein
MGYQLRTTSVEVGRRERRTPSLPRATVDRNGEAPDGIVETTKHDVSRKAVSGVQAMIGESVILSR